MSKEYDLCVKVGEYQSQGQTKGRYENIGAVMESDKGPYLILKRTFNPASVPNPDNRDTVIVSCFKPATKMPSNVKKQVEDIQAPQSGFDDFNSDIPF